MRFISLAKKKKQILYLNRKGIVEEFDNEATKIDLKGNVIVSKPEISNSQGKTVLINPIMAGSRNLGEDISQKMSYYGSNVGNMLFLEAMKEQLDYERELSPGPQRGKSLDSCSMVLPSSNFIIRGDSLFIERLQQLLDTTKGLVTVAGLGAQSNSKDDTPGKLVSQLKPYKIKFFKELAERAVSIGVRGEFTAACLEKMGIYNYRIIGCPSAYRYLDGKFSIKEPSKERCVFNVTTMNPMESKIISLGMLEKAQWIMQMMTELPLVAFENKNMTDKEFLYSFPEIGISKEKLTEYMRSNAHIFFTYKDWSAFLQENNFTFSFGSRFHGNMCALRNGVPALWITHDSRTSELVNTLHLPSIDYSTLNDVKSVEELLQYCNYEDFKNKYSKLTENYVQFLNENHLSHKFHI